MSVKSPDWARLSPRESPAASTNVGNETSESKPTSITANDFAKRSVAGYLMVQVPSKSNTSRHHGGPCCQSN